MRMETKRNPPFLNGTGRMNRAEALRRGETPIFKGQPKSPDAMAGGCLYRYRYHNQISGEKV